MDSRIRKARKCDTVMEVVIQMFCVGDEPLETVIDASKPALRAWLESHRPAMVAALFAVVAGCPTGAWGAAADSQYIQLREKTLVSGRDQHVLSTTIKGGRSMLLLADGFFIPTAGSIMAVRIELDGHDVSNSSRMDTRGNDKPLSHTFRALAAVELSDGPHTVTLVADGTSSFYLSADSGLAMMMSPANQVKVGEAFTESAVVSVDPPPRSKGVDLPHLTVASASFDVKEGPAVALSAGNAFLAFDKSVGDAMWSLRIDDSKTAANVASISDNDLTVGGESEAPLFNHGFFADLTVGSHEVTLEAESEPWPKELGRNNTVRYRASAGSRIIALSGGIRVAGRFPEIDPASEPKTDGRFAFLCIATNVKWRGCPMAGQDVVIASADIEIPQDHNGIVLFSGLTRIQGDSQDNGGSIELWLTVDGFRRGSTARQDLAAPAALSTRTVSLSYLADGKHALSRGKHTIVLHGRAIGEFKHLMVGRDTPLIWFD